MIQLYQYPRNSNICVVQFFEECRLIFGERLGLGDRWKSSAANALGISRSTLYRYCQPGQVVPPRVRERLREIAAAPTVTPRPHHSLDTLAARALVAMQDTIESPAGFSSGLPGQVRRYFDVASAMNALSDGERWPCSFEALCAWGRSPPEDTVDRWGGVLIEDDSPTDICYEAAEGAGGTEEDWEQLSLFKILIESCRQCTDPQRAYASIRSTVVTLPTASRLDIEDAFALRGTDLRKAVDLIPHLYADVPQAMEIHGKGVPICTMSGTLLIRSSSGGSRLHSEYRDPSAQANATLGKCRYIRWARGLLRAKRPVRMRWVYPGIAEMDLYERLKDHDWDCELWPDLDSVDLVAKSRDGSRRLVVDVKDVASPYHLAYWRAWDGLAVYPQEERFLVIPDYRLKVNPAFRRAFYRHLPADAPEVSLKTVSEFIRAAGTGS